PVALAIAKGDITLTVHTPSAQDYYNRGVALMNEGSHLEAALAYRRALQFDPASADAHNNLGWSLAKLGLYQEAMPVFEQAIHLRPEFALAMLLPQREIGVELALSALCSVKTISRACSTSGNIIRQ